MIHKVKAMRFVLLWLLYVYLTNSSATGLVQELDSPIDDIQLVVRYPTNLSIITSLPILLRFEIITLDPSSFLQTFGDSKLCVKLDHTHKSCYAIDGASQIQLNNLEEGQHQVSLTLERQDQVLVKSKEVTTFTIASITSTNSDTEAPTTKAITSTQDLLEWASSHPEMPFTGSSYKGTNEDYFLVIGVKARTLSGFANRQAIRSTWKQYGSSRVKLWFLGCRPPVSDTSDELLQALELERQRYGDLLTDELDCMDSYKTLVEKVKSFFGWLIEESNIKFKYVVITDDDVFLRVKEVEELLELYQNKPSTSFYAGQVWAQQYFFPERPNRDHASKYFVPKEKYPIEEYPPFAVGPHYILSHDCVDFISRNRHRLKGVGILEDVSIAVWLFALQIHPQHISSFHTLIRGGNICQNDFLSLADLTPKGIYAIHRNIQSKRPLCDGFSIQEWVH